MSLALLAAELTAPFDRADEADAASALTAGWRLPADAVERIDTEKDDTFRVTAGGRDYALKLAHPGDDAAVVDLTTVAIDHALDRDPGLPLPAWVPAVDGSAQPVVEVRRMPRIVRLAEWLPGVPLRDAARDAPLLLDLGAAQARLSLALADLRHPADERALAWDVQLLASLRPLLEAVDDAAPVAAVLDEFDHVAPALAGLPRQLIHNDANLDNVLVDGGRVSAILDFGDVVRAPRIVDLAVTLSYLLPLDGAAREAYLDGYRAVAPLDDAELALLPALVRARLAQRILLNSWMAREVPANAGYLGRNIELTARQLALALED